MGKVLMKGNEVIAEAAVHAGCKYFFGYPITPQSELVAYMARRLPEVGGLFLQAESEIAAINMVYGAAGTGVRVMTSSSSPGFSLKQEGISYLVGSELPAVICNIVRGGPGLGNIQPAQSDYFQVTKGGGHGDYNIPVLAPASLQEIVELTQEAFDIADRYRTPVIIMGDGMLGQMMEPVDFGERTEIEQFNKEWATTGTRGDGGPKIITSLELDAESLEKRNQNLQKKFALIRENEVRYETYQTDDADYIMVAFGTVARITMNAINRARHEGIKVGLIRPISLWPFPDKPFIETRDRVKAYISVEMSAGQMIEDVRLAVNGRALVDFYGRTGGVVPTQEEIYEKIKSVAGGVTI
ncbi:3-methyl-2-oxobutanoate dehydrogenase subunit VorB [Neobacillus sp. MM2021_6]|uniref:3-methyl-2-oxobutanoate dehydrogenase subunit VorB n=1 Tax=Bacillaceae TaxID=186817 RepID=UPI00140CF9E0|nr:MULTISPECIES: 3-methyl-2-oxobutanoate dehydrogenase subunit VorB [Bacillaceae]MBO0961589.1 3-methyl-2-oxobutanoate dehydrogenase subunit VorB [Neobacillus sp. MM2021_6]NHC19495.1 3-methyl-2-oxobutanoate dehydrogenase subunit VorB [Bacillus sp. MM2020_4]